MHAPPVEQSSWTRTRWSVAIGIIFVVHFGMIFWLSARPRSTTPSLAIVPPVQMLTERQVAQLPGLMDPTLFVLPSRRGFSGAAWLKVPALEHQVEDWPGPARLLPMPVTRLATLPAELVRNNLSGQFQIAAMPEPQPEVLDLYHTNLAVSASSLSIEGELRNRRLLSAFDLGPQTAAEILSNSVVRIVVNDEGLVYSPPVLLAKSGSVEADQQALKIAGAAQFDRLRRIPGRPPPPPFTTGELIFRWHTVPVPATNAPPGGH